MTLYFPHVSFRFQVRLLNGLADELFHRGELLGEQLHVPAHLLRRDFRVDLGRADARVPHQFRQRFNGYAVGKTYCRGVAMAADVPGDVFVYPALLGYFFDAVLTVGIAWDRQQLAVFGSPLVLVDDVLRHVQQADVRFHSRLLAARLYPQMPVEGNLQVFFREVRHVAPTQPREAAEDEEVAPLSADSHASFPPS